jgi:hypothetical protein
MWLYKRDAQCYRLPFSADGGLFNGPLHQKGRRTATPFQEKFILYYKERISA